MNVSVRVESPVNDSFRVQQLSGLFDVPIANKATRAFSAEIPGLDEPWEIGVICGPSGTGKTTLATQAFGAQLYRGSTWNADRSLLDDFSSGKSIQEITGMLTAVGFSSPPNWIVPYHVLSNGEKFRCDLARALLEGGDLVVFDEFSSVVDRTVAKIGSAAAASAARRLKKRFVAVSCHTDICEWLEPDWVLNTASMTLARGSLRRPDIHLEIRPWSREAWSMFKNYHYLDQDLHRSCECYLATWEGKPVAFCALLHAFGFKNRKRVSRIVTLPDYQGVGIGSAVTDHCCQIVRDRGERVTITASHPAIVNHCRKNAKWRFIEVKRTGNNPHGKAPEHHNGPAVVSAGRAVVTFEYMGA